MTVTVKLTPDSKPKQVSIDDVIEFALSNLQATVKVGGRWVPFEKKHPIVML